MIKVEQLTKDFGSNRAVDGVSFEVGKGEVLGFLGPNGAGKSTTMKMITCFIPPTSGRAEVCGYDIEQQPLEVRANIGYLPESAPSYHEMLVEEFLEFIAEVRGFRGKEKQNRVDRALEMAALKEVRKQTIETLSKGYRQRTSLAQAILHDPPVLILDEPTDGLDPNQKHEVRDLIKRMSEKCAVLVSTHILEEVEAVCTRAIIIAKGKVVADGTPEELLKRSRYHNSVSIKLESEDPQGLLSKLKGIEGVESVKALEISNTGTSYYQLFPKSGKNLIGEVQAFIQDQNLAVQQLFSEKGRLDEVFRNVTTNQ